MNQSQGKRLRTGGEMNIRREVLKPYREQYLDQGVQLALLVLPSLYLRVKGRNRAELHWGTNRRYGMKAKSKMIQIA
jgi:hypothetical protein